ncbi:UDP-N-acetylmuramate dehydrogenase [Scrofimicrobium sp. R131]|uniref:UDP-N-acetylenolpyruvoylglucosamine reductase n=1 Tax=Scrofimicrobium appendicitidis TaxID=3079930 RepID=A0AAU7V663_9ACTO
MTNLAELTTFRIGGPAGSLVDVNGPQELAEAVRTADREGQPVLVLGGGSNLLVADEGFPGVVIRDLSQDIAVVDSSGCGGNSVRVSAGTNWDDFSAYCVQQDWMGVEALAGIPGTVGAAPVQNIGAYGQEVAETLASVRVLDRLTGRIEQLALFDLHLGYRDSVLKRSLVSERAGGGRLWGPTGRWVVLEAEFQLRNASLSSPVRYRELADHLGINLGERAPSARVREAVLDLRRSKGMVLDPSDHDTWSAGSFFTNPIVDEAVELPADAPRFPVEQRSLVNSIAGKAPVVPGLVKLSAAWLIAHAGFSKGYPAGAPASLSTKHVLALTNRGGAKATDVMALATEIQRRVADKFGVQLVPEPVLVSMKKA